MRGGASCWRCAIPSFIVGIDAFPPARIGSRVSSGARSLKDPDGSGTVTTIRIRRALASDATALTAVMHGSSAYCGDYSRILDGYAVSARQVERDVVRIAERNGEIVGFYSLTLVDEPELDLMFVVDGMQGTGLGATLFRDMTIEAMRHGATAVKIISHPPSAGFYQAMGAVIVGTKAPTATANWSRPILLLRL